MIRHVFQEQRFDCMAACAAMLVGVELGYVTALIGHNGSDRPFTFREIAMFMLLYDMHLGKPLPGWPGMISTKRSEVALVIIEQPNGARHALVWDGAQYLDPRTCKTEPMGRYAVLQWWPVTRIEGA